MNIDVNLTVWRSYCAAWEMAEQLEERCNEPSLLFGVIYDSQQCQWLLNCVDTTRWITERFHGGHRGYYTEVWRQQ